MKTNKLWSIILTLVMMLSTVTFLSSCGSDDDENNGNETTGYSIIGTWKHTHENNSIYSLMTFNADGTCKFTEYVQGKISYEEKARYTYANNILTFIYDDGDRESGTINWLDKNKFSAKATDSNEILLWIRQ